MVCVIEYEGQHARQPCAPVEGVFAGKLNPAFAGPRAIEGNWDMQKRKRKSNFGMFLSCLMAAGMAGCGNQPVGSIGASSSRDTDTPSPLPSPDAEVDCDDGLFCNGMETSNNDTCVSGNAPCTSGEVCDEQSDTCQPEPGGEQGVPDIESNFFVNRIVGDDENAGRQATPFASIQAGIEAAAENGGGSVYVAGGFYVESLTLRSQVSVIGSYNPSTWILDEQNFPTTLEGGPKAVSGIGVTLVTMENFRISSADGVAPGESSVVISLSDSRLVTIRNNMLTAGNGADGVAGAKGANGAAGPDGGAGNMAASCPPDNVGGRGGSTDGSFTGGVGGTGGVAGGFNGAGGTEVNESVTGGGGGSGGATGTDGAIGGKGTDGTAAENPGVGGESIGLVSEGEYVTADGADGSGFQTNGAGGGGGGGGGGAIVFACGGGGGGGGGGGFAGENGMGGQGGGASIAILLSNNSDAEFTDNTITSGDGGNGGAGGAEGVGGTGGKGGSGGERSGAQGKGGDGGAGGTGGNGAASGSGGGGPTIGIVKDAQSNWSGRGNIFDLGEPGRGGMNPNAVEVTDGADGIRREDYTVE